jgi:hypothetical protein
LVVVAHSQQEALVETNIHSAYSTFMRKGRKETRTSRDVPEIGALVGTACQQAAAVGAKCNGMYRSYMSKATFQ